jgi:hypothetical protein
LVPSVTFCDIAQSLTKPKYRSQQIGIGIP